MKRPVLILLLCAGSASSQAQTTVNFNFEVAPDGIYLVERVEKTIANSPRKQVIETPLFLRDTVGVSSYIAKLKQRQAEAQAESDFLRSKIRVLTDLSDSLFFKPKTVAKQ